MRARGSGPDVSVVVPAYNEADNLPVFYDRLRETMEAESLTWEWIIVDDHSRDETFERGASIASRDRRVQVIRLSRNVGSHAALTCGLDRARGRCAVAMAVDLQDPPEVIPDLLAGWRGGARVVWAARRRRLGAKAATRGFAGLYYFLMRRIVGIRDMPATGADFFLLDSMVVNALRRFSESNVSLMALLTWMGYPQTTIHYDKQERRGGRSAWGLEKKLKLSLDSVTSFTYVPIRLMSYCGFVVALAGFVYAAAVAINALRGRPVAGWSSLMVVVLVLGGFQLIMMGVLGEYLWRTLDAARRRPRYLIEDSVGCAEEEDARSGGSSPVEDSGTC
jgi:dolichol-phosphate mannosyltransferase